jgi:hypothetical protein
MKAPFAPLRYLDSGKRQKLLLSYFVHLCFFAAIHSLIYLCGFARDFSAFAIRAPLAAAYNSRKTT